MINILDFTVVVIGTWQKCPFEPDPLVTWGTKRVENAVAHHIKPKLPGQNSDSQSLSMASLRRLSRRERPYHNEGFSSLHYPEGQHAVGDNGTLASWPKPATVKCSAILVKSSHNEPVHCH